MKLAIVVGHEKTTSGAYAVAPLRLSEYDYNTEVARIAYRIAMERGLQTKIFTRDGVGIKGAYKQVNEWAQGSDAVCVELHFNSFNGKVQGTETLYDNEPTESFELAREIHDCVIAVFERKGEQDRGVELIDLKDNVYERGEINFKECKVPMALLEPAFGDNKEDSQLLMNLQNDYAEAIVDGVFKYFEERDRKLAMN